MTPKLSKDLLYNSRIIDTYIKLLKKKHPDIDTSIALEYAGMQGYEVADQSHWFSQVQIDRFYKRTVELTGNNRIAREAGRYSASPEAIGASIDIKNSPRNVSTPSVVDRPKSRQRRTHSASNAGKQPAAKTQETMSETGSAEN